MKIILKETKGITLISLIITIIVLLILSIISINAVTEGNLFAHANNAATKYAKEAENENTIISSYLTDMANHDGAPGTPGGDPNAILGKYYFVSRYGDEDKTIIITQTEFIDTREGLECEYTYNSANSTITYEYEEKGKTITEGYIFNQDGLLFIDQELMFVRDNATNISRSLLDGMSFGDHYIRFLEGSGLQPGASNTYVCHNGKIYGLKGGTYTINYENGNIVSITKDDNVTYTIDSE